MEDIFQEDKNIDTYEQRIKNLESQIASLNPRNYAGIRQKELRALTRANLFGDGSDGSYVLDGTQAAVSGLFSKSSNTYTLLRDAYFEELQVKTGITLKPAGYRVFVKGDLINNGTIEANGGAGGNGGNGIRKTGNAAGGGGTGGTAGAAALAVAGLFPVTLPGIAGVVGQDFSGDASAGGAGTSVTIAIGSAGTGGGGGGKGDTGASSSGGNGGSITSTPKNLPRTPFFALLNVDYDGTPINASASSGSGGGGGAGIEKANTNVFNGGGGGGGSGAPGGVIGIYAARIINDGVISVNGGNGGNGGNGLPADGEVNVSGGGGGGAGGSGGVLILMYGILSGSGTHTATGGTGGTGGSAGGTGASAGSNGSNGNTGAIWEVEIG